MIYRMKNELERTPIGGCTGESGTVWTGKFLTGQEEMMRKGRAYICHMLNSGVSIGIRTHEGEMETMVIVRGKAVHTIDGQGQYLEEGDIIVAQLGDSHGIAQTGDESLVPIAQVLFAQMQKLQKGRLDK